MGKTDTNLSRRGLFRGVGTASLGAAACRTEPTRDPDNDATQGGESARALVSPQEVDTTINGKAVRQAVEPRTTLAEFLRLDVGLTGTKIGCDRGSCGACMVLVDGEPQNSCMLLALDVNGREVTTVEGLGSSKQLSPIQQAFVDHDALQCGFCTSGMLISCSALLSRSKAGSLDRKQVDDAIAGNLCRCGTYPHVVAAVLEANGAKGGA